MSLPGNGIFVVRGEMSTLMTAMRRGTRWSSTSYVDEEKDGLMKLFVDLKQVLNRIEDLRLIDPNIFLTPFLEVIRSEETTGAVTSLALVAINKFLSYGLIDPTHSNLAVTVESIADAVTHARFLGTDQSSDGVALFRVIEVLHTLMRSPEGSALTNESVCEMMLSCFKICFEPRLNELLRRFAEQALKDMVLLLFMRLPQFSEDCSDAGLLKKFKMMAASIDENNKKTKSKQIQVQKSTQIPSINAPKNEEQKEVPQINVEDPQSPSTLSAALKVPPLSTTPASPIGNILDMQGKLTQTPTTILVSVQEDNSTTSSENNIERESETIVQSSGDDNNTEVTTNHLVDVDEKGKPEDSEYVNSVGVRFTQQHSIENDGVNPLLPYGLPCIQELLRFLILLCNPLDKQNTDIMVHMGLSLLTVAFEVGADNIGKYETLMELVKDDLCRNLFALLNSERLSIFASDLQVCFLLFESLRDHLKFQLECYLKKLSDIIVSDNPKTPYEMRELALDNLLQLWRIPGFVAELYINYDCDLYCSDVFENITNLLSKYTLSATNAVYSTHLLSMDTLISVIEIIERNCVAAKSGGDANAPKVSSNRHSRQNSGLEGIVVESDLNESNAAESSTVVENISKFISNSNRIRTHSRAQQISREQLADVKNKKRVLTQGTELFNQRPEKGIQFLQENGILNIVLDPKEVVLFLRENPGLDKKMIGEYISKKKNVESKILENFVESFDFTGLRVDQALRLYLETFRLPGEAPLIFLVLEHFADHWHKQNNEPFANTDAAFSLAYAIIMLNMDQHNLNAKRLNVPMTPDDFFKNLRGLDGGKDFDQEMLAKVFSSIKNEEIVMPAEQTGIVKENYQWKVLLRRGVGSDGIFNHVQDSAYDKELFHIIWGASLSALSFMFDKSSENGYQRTILGFTKCAGIAAFYNLHQDFDALILTLCKFTTLLNIQMDGTNDIALAVNFGLNPKAQAAMKAVFSLIHDYGDCLRESWKNILEVFIQLFRLKLLPKSLVEVEDFCEPNGMCTLILEKPSQKPESGLFSSLYSYLSSEGQREPTYEEQEFIKIGKKCIRECQLDQMIQESKFVQFESLQELLKCVLALIKPPNAHKSAGLPYSEDIVVFWMEFMVKIVIHNRDRMITLWSTIRDQMYLLLMGGSSYGYEYLLNRSIVAILKLAIYLMRNEELCPVVLQSLKMLLMLKPIMIFKISKQISIGIYELLKTSAQNIHSELDWQIIFTILECVGAGAIPPEFEDALPTSGTKSDGALSSEEDSGLPDRGYISDTEVTSVKHQIQQVNSTTTSPFPSPSTENWILVNKDTELTMSSRPQSPPPANTLVYPCKLMEHSPFALFKCWDSLAFIVRNVAHITPYNFESCVRCIRTFVEACRDGGLRARKKLNVRSDHLKKKSTKKEKKSADQSSDSEDGELSHRYETLSIQLLDLMYTLYTRTAQIFRWWAEEGCAVPQCSALWAQGWCPLLQGIARLAMDRRREVRTYAISCLQQRALLVHDLQTLSGAEWASCFKQVLFPLLNELLPESNSINTIDKVLLEESRIRTATIMSKVFLHHLTPLIEHESFNDLWLEILDYIEKFMKVGSDMLYEQMLEILKNMLLVMHSVRVFHCNDGTLHVPLWELTWKRIGEFLPNLLEELFSDERNRPQMMSQINDQNIASIPQVAVLPQIGTDKSFNNIEMKLPGAVSTVPLESPKSSIILRPPTNVVQDKSFILTQVNTPIIIPQRPSTTTTGSPLLQQPTPPIVQPIPIAASTVLVSPTNTISSGSISIMSPVENKSDTVQSIDSIPNTEQNEHESAVAQSDATPQQPLACESKGYEFSIELPETPPPSAIANSQAYSSQMIMQEQYAEYYQHFQRQQELQNYDTFNASSPPPETVPNVPMSHVLGGNEYPSLNKLPTSSIVQSFSPVFVKSQPPVSGSDIYTDYVKNPYNLTLQHQQQQLATSDVNIEQTDQISSGELPAVTNVFQSVNYFGANVDPNSIPPGSEMLFGNP
ncbi:Golgi-specific brefeldin A-resistance guanine nucleotide exchange factor 1 [Eupeodes corollae]|uniref:Golgi-specific brefeldin A-resistance guanine nucleotide exchange factor 1 n=1 Tax=Eupeodes corollae TaxID=290404 RepID=UPI00249158F0|nr:Golgi-specific brefeldin A-resistance guanine nucleotide exchange factor 1 [Eupeodes corollae]